MQEQKDIISCVLLLHMIKNNLNTRMKKAEFGYRPIPKNTAIEALEALGDNLKFIDCWFKLFCHNYELRYGMYNKAMEKLFKQIPTMKSKPLSQD